MKVKGLIRRINATFWKRLGICNFKGCYRKSTTDVYFPNINVKRCVCDKHLLELQKQDLFSYIDER